MKLIGLMGHAGAGKDTFAEAFHYHGYRQFSFAGPLKAACSNIFGIPIEHFNDPVKKEELNLFWGWSPRRLMQHVGTELLRNEYDSEIWVRRMQYSLLETFEDKEAIKAIITDCRFKNEADFILNNGGYIIHLTRPGYDGNVGIKSHKSEQYADEFEKLYKEKPHVRVIFVNNNQDLSHLNSLAAYYAMRLFNPSFTESTPV
jgi:AraC-like DNA-binding protein